MTTPARIATRTAVADGLRVAGETAAADRIARGELVDADWYTDRTLLVDGTPVTRADCGCAFRWLPGHPPRVVRLLAGCGDDQRDHLPLAAVAGAEQNEHGETLDGAT